MRSIEMMPDVPLEFLDQKRGAFHTPALVPHGVLNLDLVEHGAVVERDEERVPDGALGGVVVFRAVARVLDAVDLGPEGVDARVRGGGVRAANVMNKMSEA